MICGAGCANYNQFIGWLWGIGMCLAFFLYYQLVFGNRKLKGTDIRVNSTVGRFYTTKVDFDSKKGWVIFEDTELQTQDVDTEEKTGDIVRIAMPIGNVHMIEYIKGIEKNDR